MIFILRGAVSLLSGSGSIGPSDAGTSSNVILVGRLDLSIMHQLTGRYDGYKLVRMSECPR